MEITIEELAQLINITNSQNQPQMITASLQKGAVRNRNIALPRHSWTRKEWDTVEIMTNNGCDSKQIAEVLHLRVGQIEGAQMVLRKQNKLVNNV
jgi:hypothetical protein